ncbi:MAG: hypothetical protein Q7R35_03490, partial [Elusimicrobiota bacterium]|nr:hypothetical protein [Elusimicrobiota bacterium]
MNKSLNLRALVLFLSLSAGGGPAGLLGWQPLACAGAFQNIIYQGTLRHDGALYTGALPMEFNITNADGSLVYWTSGSTDVYVSGGLFKYPLGTPNEAQFDAIPWSAVTPYVRLTISGSVQSADPLLSAPYALYAPRSGTAEASSGNFTLADGDLKISPAAGNRGIIFQDGSAQYTAAGSSLWQTAGPDIYASNTGNVGVGVLNPAYKLDVAGVIRSTDSAYFATAQGSVGIGLTTPTQKLEVAGAVKASAFQGSGAAVTNIAASNIVGGSFSGAPYRFTGSVALSTITVSSITVGRILIAGTLGGDVNAGGYRVTNLGAAASPSDAAIRAYVDNLTGGGPGSAAILYATQTFTGQDTFRNKVTVSGDLVIVNGSFGIGTAAPEQKLSVQGGVFAGSGITAGGGFFGDGSGLTEVGAASMPADISLSTINANALTPYGGVNIATNVYITGKAGFGLSDPAERLEVSGNVKADVFIGNGAQLVELAIANITSGSFANAAYAFPGAVVFGTVTANSVTAGNIRVTGVLGGNMNAGGYRVTNLGPPAGPDDAASKAYVDALTGGGVDKAAILFATQTFTGQNTFQYQVTVSSNLVVTDGSVGIGIAAPAHKLSVQDGILASSSITANSGFYGDGSKLTNLSAANLPAVISVSTINAGALTPYGGVSIATAVYITGKAGVGLFNPAERLEVSGNVKAAAFLGSGAQLTNITAANIAGGSFLNAAYDFPGTVALSTVAVSSITAGSLRVTGALGGDLNAGGYKVTNLGPPTSANDAVTKVYVDNATGGGNGGVSILYATQTFTGQNIFQSQVTVSSDLFVMDGNAGIGTADPGYRLGVDGDINLTGQLRRNGIPVVYTNWLAAGPDIYRLSNVGIGTAAPGAALDVEGAAQFGAGIAKSTF